MTEERRPDPSDLTPSPASEETHRDKADPTDRYLAASGDALDLDGPFESRRESKSFLAGCAPFSTLPAEVVGLIEAQMHQRWFAAGDTLVRQGDPGTSLMVICEGTVEINTEDEEGQRHFITLAGGGQVLGEMALLTDEPRSANALARTPVRVLLLPAEVFHQLASQYPLISVVLTKLLADRLGRAGRDVLADKCLDVYRIRRRLGRGGMAVVYEAEDTRDGRQVALKMMSHRLVYDREALVQFQREADIIESFDHENIVRMHGRFKAFHTFFTVMQFCDGSTLSQVIKAKGALPESVFRKILGQVARGLSYAHRAGIVHRDIKPANIMLNRDGIVKLMDFGLAKPGEDDPLLRPGTIMGTPRYMAPEQLAGEDVGPQADLFSLGCVAYEMLIGTPLFSKSAVTRISQRNVLANLPDMRRLLTNLSDESADLLNRALELDPAQRQIDLETIATWAAPIDPALIPADETECADTDWFSDTVIE